MTILPDVPVKPYPLDEDEIANKHRKPWWRSKTYWLNILTGLLALMTMPEILAVLPPDWLKWIALGNVFGNMVVRYFTAHGISAK